MWGDYRPPPDRSLSFGWLAGKKSRERPRPLASILAFGFGPRAPRRGKIATVNLFIWSAVHLVIFRGNPGTMTSRAEDVINDHMAESESRNGQMTRSSNAQMLQMTR